VNDGASATPLDLAGLTQPIAGEPGWRERAYQSIRVNARPSFEYYLLTLLSCVIATLGLLTNSVAIIIGAMLIAPLMGPIMGLSLTVVHPTPRTSRNALMALGTAVMISIAGSIVIGLIARLLPFNVLSTLPSEVTSRTQPSPFDLGVALAGGAAGAYATARMQGAAAVIGVAIATALMPPLCTVGIGIVVGDRGVWGGAFLLFLTNLVAIGFAAAIVFAGLGLRTKWSTAAVAQLLVGAVVLVGLLGLLSLLTLRTINASREDQRVRNAVNEALQVTLPGSELLDLSHNTDASTVQLQLRVQVPESTLAESQITALQAEIARRLEQPIALTFVGVPTIQLRRVTPPPVGSTATAIPTPTRTPTSIASPTRTSAATPTESPTTTPTPQPTPPQTGSGVETAR